MRLPGSATSAKWPIPSFSSTAPIASSALENDGSRRHFGPKPANLADEAGDVDARRRDEAQRGRVRLDHPVVRRQRDVHVRPSVGRAPLTQHDERVAAEVIPSLDRCCPGPWNRRGSPLGDCLELLVRKGPMPAIVLERDAPRNRLGGSSSDPAPRAGALSRGKVERANWQIWRGCSADVAARHGPTWIQPSASSDPSLTGEGCTMALHLSRDGAARL